MQEFIYTITCSANSKVYVGRTCKPSRRKREHFKNLSCNRHCNKHMQNAYNKYGEDAFSYIVVEETTNDAVKERELVWFNKLLSDGIALFNHDIETASGGVNSRSTVTRTYIFEVLDAKYNERLNIKETCKRFNVATQTLQDYTEEWESLRGLKMPRNLQIEDTLKRVEDFVEAFKVEGKDAYRRLKDFKLSHQSLVKYLPKFGLSFEDVRLDAKFKSTKDRALKAVEDYNNGGHFAEAIKKHDISIQTFYKYLKEQNAIH